ncbi:hypothetical protein IAT38_001746 [Cryptococcus sp. DSM 104549]
MFTTSTTAIYALASLALAGPALAGAIFQVADAKMTFYYDVSPAGSQACGSTAGDPVVANWAVDSGINAGVPFCESARGYSLDKIGTNRIVAFNAALVASDPAKWCGREVQVYNSDGSKFDFSEGSFYIWDGCAACESTNSQILDLSAPAFAEVKGGTCGGTNPTGLSYEVLDTYVVDPSVGMGPSYTAESGSGTSDDSMSSAAASSAAPTTTKTSSSAAAVTTASTAAAEAPAVPTTTQSAAQVTATSTRTHRYSSSIETVSAAVSDEAAKGDARLAAAVVETTDAEDSETEATTKSASKTASSASSTETLSASGCKYGAWQCDGLKLQVCNYLTVSSLGWETIETCTSVCEVTSSGSVDCQ